MTRSASINEKQMKHKSNLALDIDGEGQSELRNGCSVYDPYA